ncbi:unnamed protein product [Meloidogyne enterolobii]|uniref:Uncharacterized protein n=1 Tax=Meloidogyne enterolobii TaxID=390850 RepID=A0ACB0Y606_MELEN
MLFVNIVIIIFINTITQFANSLRYILLVFIYTNPCQLLTPLWLTSILVGSLYLQQICYPSLHFCVMLERLRATLFLDKYENEGRKLTLFMIIFSVRFFILKYSTLHNPKTTFSTLRGGTDFTSSGDCIESVSAERGQEKTGKNCGAVN